VAQNFALLDQLVSLGVGRRGREVRAVPGLGAQRRALTSRSFQPYAAGGAPVLEATTMALVNLRASTRGTMAASSGPACTRVLILGAGLLGLYCAAAARRATGIAMGRG
jgi:threonine dehydrogenase-like Zn-dependent dehydrogenase